MGPDYPLSSPGKVPGRGGHRCTPWQRFRTEPKNSADGQHLRTTLNDSADGQYLRTQLKDST